MKELKDKFYKNCLFLVQNFKDASERDIEQQVNDVANMPIFKDIDQKTVLETIKRIEHVEGVTMSSATCLSDDKNIKDWLTNERIILLNIPKTILFILLNLKVFHLK